MMINTKRCNKQAYELFSAPDKGSEIIRNIPQRDDCEECASLRHSLRILENKHNAKCKDYLNLASEYNTAMRNLFSNQDEFYKLQRYVEDLDKIIDSLNDEKDALSDSLFREFYPKILETIGDPEEAAEKTVKVIEKLGSCREKGRL